MFIDYVTLMLINMAAGLVVLAAFIWKDIDKDNNQFWAPAFALPGMIAAALIWLRTGFLAYWIHLQMNAG